MGVKCILCAEKYVAGSHVSFHKFPKEESKRLKWINQCNLNANNVYKTAVICSKHFIPDCFVYKNKDLVRRQQKLRVDAVPTIFYNKKTMKRKYQSTTQSNESFLKKRLTSFTGFPIIDKLYRDLIILDHSYCRPRYADKGVSKNTTNYSINRVLPILKHVDCVSTSSETKPETEIYLSSPPKLLDDVITPTAETSNTTEVYVCSIQEDDDPIRALKRPKSVSEMNLTCLLEANDDPLATNSETKTISENSKDSSTQKSEGNDKLGTELNISTSSSPTTKITPEVCVESPSDKNVRYIGELTEDHFDTPEKRKKNLLLVKLSHKKLQRKLKLLNEKCRRLTKRVDSLKGVIKYLNEDQNVSKKTPHKIKM